MDNSLSIIARLSLFLEDSELNSENKNDKMVFKKNGVKNSKYHKKLIDLTFT